MEAELARPPPKYLTDDDLLRENYRCVLNACVFVSISDHQPGSSGQSPMIMANAHAITQPL